MGWRRRRQDRLSPSLMHTRTHILANTQKERLFSTMVVCNVACMRSPLASWVNVARSALTGNAPAQVIADLSISHRAKLSVTGASERESRVFGIVKGVEGLDNTSTAETGCRYRPLITRHQASSVRKLLIKRHIAN